MRTFSWPCSHISFQTSARSLGFALSLCAAAGCENGPAVTPPASRGAAGSASIPIATPSNAGSSTIATLPPSASDATTAPSGGSGDPAAMIDSVAAHGVTGRLVPSPFLSDAGEGRRNLILVDWEIPAGSEQYLCARITVTEDAYFSRFYPINPLGTHHTAVTIEEHPDMPDGVTECDVSEVGSRNVFGSGVGTTARTLPPGVAMKVERGTQILLNLHLFNFADTPLRGRSGTEAETTPASDVKVLADGVAVGPLKLMIPPGRSVHSGVCTVDHDYTIFGLMPHMHQMGVHMKLVAHFASGGEMTLHDAAYDFENQLGRALGPLDLKKGDTMTVECTYENTTGETLHFGESSKDEMCLAAVARYPAGGKTACPY